MTMESTFIRLCVKYSIFRNVSGICLENVEELTMESTFIRLCVKYSIFRNVALQ